MLMLMMIMEEEEEEGVNACLNRDATSSRARVLFGSAAVNARGMFRSRPLPPSPPPSLHHNILFLALTSV